MKIVIGLGNPGKKYQHTRHNAGFLALDYFMAEGGWRRADWQNNFNAKILETSTDGQKVILAEPQTFMNESGKAVRDLCSFYKIDIKHDLLVIHDDSDLPLGTFRTAFDSSSAGHNGVQNVIDNLGAQKFHRLRIGIETRANRSELPTDAFVLQIFTEQQLKLLQDEVLPKVAGEITKFLNQK